MNRCFHMYVFIISSVFQLGLHVNSHCSSPHLISPEFADAEVASGNMAWQQAVQDPESVENSHWMADSPILVGGFKSSEKYECQLGWLFPIYGKLKLCSKPPTRIIVQYSAMIEPWFCWKILNEYNHCCKFEICVRWMFQWISGDFGKNGACLKRRAPEHFTVNRMSNMNFSWSFYFIFIPSCRKHQDSSLARV